MLPPPSHRHRRHRPEEAGADDLRSRLRREQESRLNVHEAVLASAEAVPPEDRPPPPPPTYQASLLLSVSLTEEGAGEAPPPPPLPPTYDEAVYGFSRGGGGVTTNS